MLYIYNLQKPGTFGVPIRIFPDNDKKLFKIHKTMTVLGERGQMTALLITQDASDSDVPCRVGTTGFIQSMDRNEN